MQAAFGATASGNQQAYLADETRTKREKRMKTIREDMADAEVPLPWWEQQLNLNGAGIARTLSAPLRRSH